MNIELCQPGSEDFAVDDIIAHRSAELEYPLTD